MPAPATPQIHDDTANPLTRALERLVERHHLSGAVLVAFSGDRIGAYSVGLEDVFGQRLEHISELMLRAIADGQFGPLLDNIH